MNSVTATSLASTPAPDRIASTGAELPLRGLRVAHVLPWGLVGGVEHGTLRLASALRHAGAVCTAFCVGTGSPVQDLFRDAGFATEGFTGVEPSIRQPVPYLQASRRLAGSLRRWRADVVHCADLLAGYHGGLAGRLAGARVLCHVRGEFPVISRRDALFLRLVQHFVFVSRHTWRSFGLQVSEARGSVLYDGVPLASHSDADAATVRAELGLPVGSPVVGMIARVAPGKDFETLIRAAVRLANAGVDARFLIVGDKESSDTHRARYAGLERELHAAGVRDCFHFTGYRKDVPRLVAAMDVVVLITHSEGLPLVLLEGMAAGKPVVATRVGGVPELLTPGSGGQLHEPGDDADLAAALLPLLTQPGHARRQGHTAREHIRSLFSEDQFAHGVIRLYSRVIEPASQRPAIGEMNGTSI